MRITFSDWPLFVRKTAMVFGLTLLLVPLLEIKGALPAKLYLGGLVVLHVFVLVVYFYRVRFREVAPTFKDVALRVMALGLVTWLLTLVSTFDAESGTSRLISQALAVSGLHTVMLLLLMARLERPSHVPVAASRDS